MKAFSYSNYGPVDDLTWKQVPDPPQPEKDMLRIRVTAAALNPADAMIREGRLPRLLTLGWPKVVGFDFAGVVEEVGPDARRFRVGDRIAGFAPPGRSGVSLAEYALVAESWAAAIPDGVEDTHAAAVSLAGTTAYQALVEKSSLGPGMRVLVSGASGGVGHLAVQIVNLYGAEVTGWASARNHDFLRTLGVTYLVDYEAQGTEVIADRYNLVFDSAGVWGFRELTRMLKPDGHFVTTRPDLKVPVGSLLNRFRGGARGQIMMARPDSRTQELMLRWLAEKRLQVYLSEVYPAQRAVDALRQVATGHTRGKLAIDMTTL